MRISRQWRDLQARKRFGFGHDLDRVPGTGDLALFCPSCPQPGINLPDQWRTDVEKWLLRRVLVVDGNFSAENMHARRPEDDVSLTDGEAYMVKDGPYRVHLLESIEDKAVSKPNIPKVYAETLSIQRSTCNNHSAINAANMNRKNLYATGVGTCACARHGCFVPNAMVDFQKGERQVFPSPLVRFILIPCLNRQMNMDYSICNALAFNTKGLPEALVIYDVICQHWKKFHSRVDRSNYLALPSDMDIIAAIGKFHLSAHIRACFAFFSLNFVQGAGQVEGEICETLWADFNPVASTARGMSKAHRREVLDDFMRDSNWKKLVGIGELSTMVLQPLYLPSCPFSRHPGQEIQKGS